MTHVFSYKHVKVPLINQVYYTCSLKLMLKNLVHGICFLKLAAMVHFACLLKMSAVKRKNPENTKLENMCF
ncbi:hypothetical protein X975_08816, partial [Stegodyphus mimosarum]